MYTVIGATKTRTLRVLWLLEELGLPYDQLDTPPRSDDVFALNPLGRIPVLRDGAAVLTDSVAIMSYLGDRHPDAGPPDGTGGLSAPAGTPKRAQIDALNLQLIDEFDALLWTRARHSFILPAERRVPAVLESLAWELQRNTDALAQSLGTQPFLLGAKMTSADILATHCMGWAITSEAGIDPPENLAAYLKRMRARPAYRRALGRPAH